MKVIQKHYNVEFVLNTNLNIWDFNPYIYETFKDLNNFKGHTGSISKSIFISSK